MRGWGIEERRQSDVSAYSRAKRKNCNTEKGDLRAMATILRLGGTHPKISSSGGQMVVAMVVAGNEHGKLRF